MRSAERTEARGRPDGFPQPVFGAESLYLGVNVALEQYDPQTLEARLADLAARGVAYLRQEFRWDEIEPQPGQFDWAVSDRIVEAARRHNFRILAVLWTTPEWARTPTASARASATRTAPPYSVRDFARFAGAFARRYDATGAILAYQIWDEPNLSAAWGDGLVNPTYYLQLLRAARTAIHQVNPQARIVLAALAPTVEQSNVNLAPQTYLLKLYQLGGHQAFDIVAAKPYGFSLPPEDRRVDAGLLNFAHVILMREMMVAHNEGHKAIWATQFGWNALPPGWGGEPSIWGQVSEAEQAEYLHRAVRRAAREWHWMGAMFVHVLQPAPRAVDPLRDAQWGFALLDPEGRPRPVMAGLEAALAEAARAPRAQLFANCASPQSVYRTLNLENVMTAMPEVLAAEPDCRAPNPQATFSPGWRFDQLGADIPDRSDARVVFRFHGDALALIVRRGNYRAYTFVEIDGKPANLLPREPRGAYLIMTSPGLYPVIETIPVAEGLGDGAHTAVVTVDRGWNQWALIGWSSLSLDDRPPWGTLYALAALLGIIGLGIVTWSAPRAQWRQALDALRTTLAQAPPPLVRAQAFGLGLVVWLGSALTWALEAATAYRALGLSSGVVLPALVSAVGFWSPAFVVTLAALSLLAVLVVLRLEVGLMLLAFFVPFYLQPQRLFERSFAMVELLALMCTVGWAIRVAGFLLRHRRAGVASLRAVRVTLLDAAVLGLLGVALLSALQADFRTEAFREFRLVILGPGLAYLILRTLPYVSPSRAQLATWSVVDGFVLGAVVVAAIGLLNYMRGETIAAEFGLPRIKSVFGSPNNDALYLERALAVMLGGALASAGRLSSRHLLYAAGLVPVAAALLLSQSRGAILLGVPAALVTILVLAGGRWRWLGIALGVGALVSLGVLFSGAAAPLLEGTRFARLAAAFDWSSGTGFFRLNLWQSALTMWRDHFWLGVGLDNFLYAYRSFYILPAAWQEPNLSHPHNIGLDFATRLGIGGVLVGIGLILGYIRLVRRTLLRDRALALGAAGMLAAMLGHGLVDHSFFLIELAYPFMLLAGSMAANLTQGAKVEETGH